MKRQIGDIIGDRNKIDMIIGLYREGSQKKTDVYAFTTNNNLNARKLDELEQEGIISMARDSFDNNKTTVTLTLEGRAVAIKLLEIEGILSGELAASGAEMDYDPPHEQRDSVS